MEYVFIASALIVGFVIGLIVGYVRNKLRKPKLPVYDGVLELFPTEESLVLGLDVRISGEDLQKKTDALFKINSQQIHTV